jgi:IclR family transcriptional regulator, acetate operon repressor
VSPAGDAAIVAPAGTQAIVRAVRLLKAVAAAGEMTSLADLSAELGLSKPTVHRMLAALESEGLVAREGTGVRLGSAVVTLGAQALAGSNLRAMARRHLEKLALESGETATLEIPTGNSMLILDEVRGGQLVGAHVEVGTQWPMYATSTGKAFLAGLPAADLALRARATRRQLTPATLVASEDLLSACGEARRLGFAVTQEELEAGYCAVGAVVFGPGGGVVAALSLGGPSERMGTKRLRELGATVVAAARALSQELGG